MLTGSVTKTEHWTAEILWALKTVVARYSYASCEKVDHLFKRMFPDSKIAEAFSCGEKKCSYILCFGLAPYFRDVLLNKISGVDFVLLFDESLNHKTQNKQMDIYIRYFDETLNQVTTRYFDTAFIGHSTADDLLNHFLELTRKLDLNRLIQLSMDGPNVNWAFYEKLSGELKSDSNATLINIGSCGLHIVHGAFKSACHSVDWDISGLLKSMHRLFKDTPARRDDFTSITGCTVFPAKHCPTRWIEDVPVAKKAIELLPHLKTYVETVIKNPKKYTVPKTQSFEQVKDAVQDHLTLVKLQFFVSLAEEFLPFLSKYQTDEPVLPFLCEDLERLLRDLMRRCVKSQTLTAASSVLSLLKVNVTKDDVLKSPKNVDVGFSATHKLKELLATKQISERQILEFRSDCRTILVTGIEKVVEKSPVKYSLVRNVSCLVPERMASKPDCCRSCFSRTLSTLVKCKRIPEDLCDILIKQYDTFIIEVVQPKKREFKDYDYKTQRLDDFLRAHMVRNYNTFGRLWGVVQLLLTLSHGQASVERGFSINKGLLVDNLSENSICAQRVVFDYVQSCGGLLNVPITREVIVAAQSGRMKYKQYLENMKKEQKESETAKKRKLCLDEIHQLERKRSCLEQDIQSLHTSADKLAEQAEKVGNMLDLTKSNSFRRTAKAKSDELDVLSSEIKRLKDNLQ